VVGARGATTSVALLAGRRVTFTTVWILTGVPPVPSARPDAAAGGIEFLRVRRQFVPEAGHTYVIRFPDAPDGHKPACGAIAELDGTPQSGQGRSDPFAYPHRLRGADAFQPGGLCALGAN
jgi:hypothetical protein